MISLQLTSLSLLYEKENVLAGSSFCRSGFKKNKTKQERFTLLENNFSTQTLRSCQPGHQTVGAAGFRIKFLQKASSSQAFAESKRDLKCGALDHRFNV